MVSVLFHILLVDSSTCTALTYKRILRFKFYRILHLYCYILMLFLRLESSSGNETKELLKNYKRRKNPNKRSMLLFLIITRNFFVIYLDLLPCFMDLIRKYGPVVHFNLFDRSHVLLNDPDDLKVSSCVWSFGKRCFSLFSTIATFWLLQ